MLAARGISMADASEGYRSVTATSTEGEAMTGPDDAFLAPDDALLDVPEASPPGTEAVEPPGSAVPPREDGVEDVGPVGGESERE